MRLLGVDFGFKRIGLAVGEASFGIFDPRPTLNASGTLARDADALKSLAAIVLGLPLEESGEEGRMARICRQLGGLLTERGLTVHYVDERFTSREADDELYADGLKASQRRKHRDGEAARRILERFLQETKF
jgi:putative Holliday junction resolvase